MLVIHPLSEINLLGGMPVRYWLISLRIRYWILLVNNLVNSFTSELIRDTIAVSSLSVVEVWKCLFNFENIPL